MKRTITALAVVAVAGVIGACGGNDDPAPVESDEPTVAEVIAQAGIDQRPQTCPQVNEGVALLGYDAALSAFAEGYDATAPTNVEGASAQEVFDAIISICAGDPA